MLMFLVFSQTLEVWGKIISENVHGAQVLSETENIFRDMPRVSYLI